MPVAPDRLAEPWAIPLQEARLSTFLAADRNVAQVDDASTDTTEAFLRPDHRHAKSRLNLTSLVEGGHRYRPAPCGSSRGF